MPRLKVLVVLPSFDRGGAESYCLRLIQFSRDRAIEWHVTSGNLRNAQMESEFTAAGAMTHRNSPGLLSPKQGLAFREFLKRYRFDVVMTLTGLFGGATLSLARAVGVPGRIAWHRRSSPAFSPTPLRRLYARLLLWRLERAATSILSNSQVALTRFHGERWRDQLKFRVIQNGVDPQRFHPQPALAKEVRSTFDLPASAVVVGHIGRFDPAKDHETLFNVIRKTREQGVDAWLLCAGTGTDSTVFRQQLKAHQILDFTRSLGPRSDIERLHQAMDIFLFPSVTEGQPNSLIEAMLSGVRILASDIPPIREAIPEFLFGDLFSPGDADAASRLLAAPASRDSEKIARARKWAINRYDPQRNFNAVLEIMGL